jgi:CheY-like chemotaxis protein
LTQKSSSTQLKNARILVVEDEADARELLHSMLEKCGATVVTAESVDAAVEIYRQCPPHAIISDIRLGNSDGYDLIKAIRETNKEYRGFTPAVAVTGFASPNDEKRAIAAGFNAYFSKPFDAAQVIGTIAKLLRAPVDLAA